jgi:GTP-binding protein Era
MKQKTQDYRVGNIALVGRPNVGKSTLLNALVGQKVSIISKKPQTTRSQIMAVYEDERGQLFFHDTPGLFLGKAAPSFSRMIDQTLSHVDVVVYVVDRTRDWGNEDERIWNKVNESEKPVLLVINKVDVNHPDFTKTYEILLGKRVAKMLKLSALEQTHIKGLIAELFLLSPAGSRQEQVDLFPSPLLSQSGPEFLAEIIREKVYERCGAEVPYQVTTRVVSIDSEDEELMKVKGLVMVPSEHYKPMLIGANGKMIASIRKAVEKELRVMTGKEARVRLDVVLYDEV